MTFLGELDVDAGQGAEVELGEAEEGVDGHPLRASGLVLAGLAFEVLALIELGAVAFPSSKAGEKGGGHG